MLQKIVISIMLFISSVSYATEKVTVITSKDYNWDKIVNKPESTSKEVGNQILHFGSRNKHYSLNKESINFVETYLLNAQKLSSDAEALQAGSDAVNIEGIYIEAGVCTGRTINFIAALNSLKTVYGFDSFKGLPEDWVKGNHTFKKNTFSTKDKNFIPAVLHNVILYKGWFKDSLPVFKSTILQDQPIAFLHVDSDIYSAAKDIFNILGNNIIEGTIIVFDEIYNYPNYQEHEWKAFQEFLKERNLTAEYLAFNQNHEQVVVRIKKP